MSINCSHNFHKLPNDDLKTFGDGVDTGFYGNNPPFILQPMPQPAFQALIIDFDNKLSDYQKGGDEQKGPFLVAKEALMDALDDIATEVDKVADGDANIIILAGFVPTKERGETSKPGQGTVTVKRGIAGELISTCELVNEARHYGCIMTEGAPLPEWVVIDGNGRIVWENTPDPGPDAPVSIQLDFTDQRTKHFLNLKHDVTYYFYYYAVNAKGVGPLSEAVSMVCW